MSINIFFLVHLGISLFQSPSTSMPGILQEKLTMAPTEGSHKFELPTNYTIVPAVAMKKESILVPKPPNEINTINGKLIGAKSQEKDWINHALRLIDKETCMISDEIAWSAYHASLQHPSEIVRPALTQLLPLFMKRQLQ